MRGYTRGVMMRHIATFGVPPPTDPRDRIQSGRFLRTLLLRWLGVSLVLWVLVVVITGAATWALVLGGAALLMLAADVIWLNYRVRRDEREGRPGNRRPRRLPRVALRPEGRGTCDLGLIAPRFRSVNKDPLRRQAANGPSRVRMGETACLGAWNV